MQVLTLLHGDCVARMAEMPDGSVDAIVCDPPYGLEFQGVTWDAPWKGSAEDKEALWRTSAGMSKVGLGGREAPWPSFGGGDSANASCATCGGCMRGAKKCLCDKPEWRVKGKPLDQQHTKTAQMQTFGRWSESWLRQAYRVLKPEGRIYAFGGTRTHHRLSAAMAAAGFADLEMRAWSYSTGFPKSLNVSAAMDKQDKAKAKLGFVCWMRTTGLTSRELDVRFREAGMISQKSLFSVHFFNEKQPALPTTQHWQIIAQLLKERGVPLLEGIEGIIDLRENGSAVFREREVIGQKRSSLGGTVAAGSWDQDYIDNHREAQFSITAPATKEAEQWQGWHTALKPSWEAIVVGRKPSAVIG